ncbi:biotin transporter BioY [Lactobacillus sp. LC28-10]|uniref:Biotin transporter n=1 Tax=Secundilactobacillus angelensis TaxID=2722706 RepID=A0ABX1L263_9LACO|nr:biotin transporter BioY [Secundilactobacillus angelensis]MCH5463235.1 biotin transporter BioY [Secundilactobacillus angelensis]NLR19163.1 biotin transporter BioY [Secundilactobacillus angelensis]
MNSNQSLLSWILASQFAAILVVCSKLTIPLGPIPLTGQTLAVGTIASLLTVRTGQKAIFLYLLLGLLGLPVFAGSSTSLAALFGPTAGYLWGFFVYVTATAWLLNNRKKGVLVLFVANLVGAILQLIMGSLWLTVSNQLSIPAAFLTGFVPFLIPAVIKIIMVVAVVQLIQQRVSLPLGREGN